MALSVVDRVPLVMLSPSTKPWIIKPSKLLIQTFPSVNLASVTVTVVSALEIVNTPSTTVRVTL